MLWIGLTGGIASGKSTVAQLLRTRGFDVIDADLLAREVVQKGTPGFQEVVGHFGQTVVGPDGELARAKLGEMIFRDAGLRAELEAITHPRIRARTEELKNELKTKGRAVAFYDVPLLFEKKMSPLFDRVLVVSCSEAKQIERLMSRNGLPKVEAERRLASQLSLSEKVKHADDVILNEGSLEHLEQAVDAYVSRLPAAARRI